MSEPAVHQLLEGARPGDAQHTLAIAIGRWLAKAGYASRTFAATTHPRLAHEVGSVREARNLDPRDILIYHFGALGDATSVARSHVRAGGRLVLFYHCFTPPSYFRSIDEGLYARLVETGRAVESLAGVASVAMANSEFAASDLRSSGSQRVVVVSPAVLDERWEIPPDASVLERFGDGRTNLLTVGRVVPNKRLEDLINVFICYRRINPESRLLLVGHLDVPAYTQWLRAHVEALALPEVYFCGDVSQAELNAYYRVASVLVSMSEHEGFGVPLVEGMYLGVPVLAYRAAAVPETMGDAGIVVGQKDFPVIAEVIDVLRSDPSFRERIVGGQRERARRFRLEAVERRFWEAMAPLALVPWVTRDEALALNVDHHRRMTEEARRQERAGETGLYRRRDEESYQNLLRWTPAGGRALELGAGAGHAFPLLSGHFASVEGIDCYEPVVGKGRARGYMIHVGTIEDLSLFPDSSFDAVVSRHTMEHSYNLRTLMTEIFRVLRPGGFVGAVTPHYFPDPEPAHLNQFDRDQWSDVYRRFGFEIVYCDEFLANAPECHIVARKA